MTRSEATHATSGFHGSLIRLSASGLARMSGSAGVMSNHTAKPAKPAPDFATESIALAGTSFARMVPNRSTNEIRKNLIPCCLAMSLHAGMLLFLAQLGSKRIHHFDEWELVEVRVAGADPPNSVLSH